MSKYLLHKLVFKDNNYVWFSDKREYIDFVFWNKTYVFFKEVLCNILSINENQFFSNMFANPETNKRPVSLRNIGLNCYLNSSFQSIVACTDFVREMKELENHYPTSNSLIIFNKILESLNNPHCNDIELSSNPIFRNWNRPGEQDTFEILSYVVFQVFNELRKIHQDKLPEKDRTIKNWIQRRLPLKILIEFKIKCDCGFNFTPNLQSDLALHLSVPVRVYSEQSILSIDELLDKFFIPENLSDFQCLNPECTGRKITKSIILQKPMPNTLCLHVQRSFWNPQTNMMEKNNEKISFKEELTLKNDFFLDNRNYVGGPMSSAFQEFFKRAHGNFDGAIEREALSVNMPAPLVNGDHFENTSEKSTSPKRKRQKLAGSYEANDEIEPATTKIEMNESTQREFPVFANMSTTQPILQSKTEEGKIYANKTNMNTDLATEAESESNNEDQIQINGDVTNDTHIVPCVPKTNAMSELEKYDDDKLPGKDISLSTENDSLLSCVEKIDEKPSTLVIGQSSLPADGNAANEPKEFIEKNEFEKGYIHKLACKVFEPSNENEGNINTDPPTTTSVIEKSNMSIDDNIYQLNEPRVPLKPLETIEDDVYFLKSVIVHFGRAESGHYICYRKCGDRWFCTNDNFVHEVTFDEVQNSQAYILMYEKSL